MKLRALASVSLVLASLSGSAQAGGMTGSFYVRIEPTDPFDAISSGLDPSSETKALGLGPSPKPSGNEIADALAHFENPQAAMDHLEKLKRDKNYQNGKVFARFGYTSRGDLDMICGVSSANSNDLTEVTRGTTHANGIHGGAFSGIKLASRDERVRAIARCLAGMPGMTERLKPLRPKLTGILVDGDSYRLGETWFKKQKLIGTPAQYRAATECMAAELGRSLTEATGDSVVMMTKYDRSWTAKTTVPAKDYFSQPNYQYHEVVDKGPSSLLIVTNKNAARKIFKSGDLEKGYGIWPMHSAFPMSVEDRTFEELFKPVWGSLEGCRLQAGLVGAGFAKGFINTGPKCDPKLGQ